MKRKLILGSLVLICLTAVIFICIQDKTGSKKKNIQIAVSFSDMSNARTTAIYEDIIGCIEKADYTVAWRNAESDVEQQQRDIMELMDYNPEYLVVMPVRTRGIEQELLQASNQDIKIILLDRTLDNFKNIPIYAELRTDAIWEGESCADLLAAYFGGQSGNILEISGEKGTSINKMHSTGFRNQLQNYSNLEIAGNIEGNGDRGTARSSVISYIMNNQDTVDAIFANTDEEGLGAIAALEELGLRGKIPVVSINGVKDVKNAMKAGGYYGCVEATPFLGETLIRLIEAEHSEKKDVEFVKGKIYTSENLEQMQGY